MRISSLSLLILLLVGSSLTHRCVHDSLFREHPPRVAEEVPESEVRHLRNLAASDDETFTPGHLSSTPSWHGIRIAIDYSYATAFVQKNGALFSRYKMIIRIVQSVRSYFQNNLAVYSAEYFRFSGGNCYNNKIPSFNSPIDLFITIYPENDQSTDYFAAATSCHLSTTDYRPVTGAYILNLAFLKEGTLKEFLLFSTFAHEFTHILGFSSNLFDKYVQAGTKNTLGRDRVATRVNIGGRSVDAIVLQEVVGYARWFFNCGNLPGVPLEDNGGEGSAGSHWEKLFLPQEYMNPSVENPGIISEFTFALLRGSGWYKTRRYAAQAYDWGQGMGCSHFEICPKGNGYCEKSQVGSTVCSSEWRSFGVCVSDTTFGNSCPVKRSKEHSCTLDGITDKRQGEYYGPGSRCVNYRGGSKCHGVRCDANGITIYTGQKSVHCSPSESGQTKTTEVNHILVCPDYRDFCGELSKSCPQDCSTRGLCLESKTCHCYSGWTGSTCSETANIDYNRIVSSYI